MKLLWVRRWMRRFDTSEKRINNSSPRRRFRPRLEVLEDRLAPAVWTVVNTADANMGNAATNQGDLRWCLSQAGAGDTVDFNIPGGGVQTIQVGSALRTIAVTLTIDGTTQPGWVAGGAPKVVVEPTEAQAGFNGLTITGLIVLLTL
jgi:hypothetical protein